VRIVQGGHVEADDIIDPSEFQRFSIKGGGGSNMSPSLRMLADTSTESTFSVRSPSGLPIDRVDALIDGRPDRGTRRRAGGFADGRSAHAYGPRARA